MNEQARGRKLPVIGLGSWLASLTARASQIPAGLCKAVVHGVSTVADTRATVEWSVVDTLTGLAHGQPHASCGAAWRALSLIDIDGGDSSHCDVQRTPVADVTTHEVAVA